MKDLKVFTPFLDDWAVRSLVSGNKTQARQLVARSNSVVGVGEVDWSKFTWRGRVRYKEKLNGRHPEAEVFVDGLHSDCQYLHVPWDFEDQCMILRVYPRVEPGVTMVVRESWVPTGMPGNVVYRADLRDMRGDFWHSIAHDPGSVRWRSPAVMPLARARIRPLVKRVRAQRLEDMTETDARAAGMVRELDYGKVGEYPTALAAFRGKWEARLGGGAWDPQAWVWVYEWDAIRLPVGGGVCQTR